MGGGSRTRGGALALAASIAMAAVFAATVQAAPLVVCGPGAGAGQCSTPAGTAVDTEDQLLYVADRGNKRVDVFEVTGGEVKFKFAFGSPGTGDGQFENPSQVAVDNDPASAAHHDVYVYDRTKQQVQRFHPDGAFVAKTAPGTFVAARDPLATGPGGFVYVGDTIGGEVDPRVKKFDSNLVKVGECEPEHNDRLNIALAVDSTGALYASFNKGGGAFKFTWAEPVCPAVGAPYPLIPGLIPTALSIGAGDRLFAADAANAYRVISRFSSTGATERRFGFGQLTGVIGGLAPLETPLGDVFASEESSSGQVKYLSEPPPGPVVAGVEAQAPVVNVRATLKAEIDPEGKASEYQFEYVTQAHYEAGGFAGAEVAPAAPTSLDGGAADFGLHLASAQIGCPTATKEALEAGECLVPLTPYRFRVSATNSDGGGNGEEVEGTFTTAGLTEIEEAFASEVGADSARFSVRVNPLGIATSGWFEYVTESACEEAEEEAADEGLGPEEQEERCYEDATEVPDVGAGANPLEFGSGESGVLRSVQVALAPGTAYRLRARATDPLIEEGVVPGIDAPLKSEQRRITTFTPPTGEACPENQVYRQGPAALLPDCRAYEMVSPVDKEGGEIITVKDPSFYPLVLTQSSLGGDKLVYGSYRAFGDAKAAPITSQYLAARGPSGWSSHYIQGPRGRLVVKVTRSVIGAEVRYLSPDLCRAWIKTFAEPTLAPAAIAGFPNLYRRSDQSCEGESWQALTTAEPAHGKIEEALEFEGASEDETESIFIAGDNLEGTTAPDLGGERMALYYQEGEGTPKYVCYTPAGAPMAESCGGGTTVFFLGRQRDSSLTGAISADGERVFFSAPASITGTQTGKIYLREHPGAEQSAVAGGECTEAAKACTLAVSAKGEELSGASNSQFWQGAKNGSAALFSAGSDLYRYDVATKATTLIAHEALGVMGASADLSRVYFASEEKLTAVPNPEGEEAEEGKANLYLQEGEGAPRFIAALAGAHDPNTEYTAITPLAVQRNARVSADGERAVFVSRAPLTGYDNTDAKSGEADSEVFYYEAAANGGEGRLVCVSCNPSGGRPEGELRKAISSKFWAAAWVAPWKSSLQPGRVMSADGGRVYFTARDALAPRDSNGRPDVYQWEAPGTGGCEESDPEYSAQNQGCISLLSSGQSAGGAEMLDASQSGDDVFFTTVASLVGQDHGLIDVYDARVGGGLPSPVAEDEECEGEACQSPAPAPEMLLPGSLRYEGPANQVQKAKPKKCPKGKVRRKGRCVKKKAHKKHAKHRRRAVHRPRATRQSLHPRAVRTGEGGR